MTRPLAAVPSAPPCLGTPWARRLPPPHFLRLALSRSPAALGACGMPGDLRAPRAGERPCWPGCWLRRGRHRRCPARWCCSAPTEPHCVRAGLRRLPGEPVPGPPAAGGAALTLPAARWAARAVAGRGWRVPGRRPPGHFLSLQGGADRGGTERGPGAGGGFPTAWRPAPGSGCWSRRGNCRWPSRPSRAPPARGGAAGTFASCSLRLPSVSPHRQRLASLASLASAPPASPTACSQCCLASTKVLRVVCGHFPRSNVLAAQVRCRGRGSLLVWRAASELLLLPWQVAQRSLRAPSSAQALQNRASPAHCSRVSTLACLYAPYTHTPKVFSALSQ